MKIKMLAVTLLSCAFLVMFIWVMFQATTDLIDGTISLGLYLFIAVMVGGPFALGFGIGRILPRKQKESVVDTPYTIVCDVDESKEKPVPGLR